MVTLIKKITKEGGRKREGEEETKVQSEERKRDKQRYMWSSSISNSQFSYPSLLTRVETNIPRLH